jgi:hypothetical protein
MRMLMCCSPVPVGNFVTRWWPNQRLYDPSSKPYASLTALLDQDPYFRAWLTGSESLLLLKHWHSLK